MAPDAPHPLHLFRVGDTARLHVSSGPDEAAARAGRPELEGATLVEVIERGTGRTIWRVGGA